MHAILKEYLTPYFWKFYTTDFIKISKEYKLNSQHFFVNNFKIGFIYTTIKAVFRILALWVDKNKNALIEI